ncbi:MAG: lamin tail domain-containing protein [Fidelibacterota bacterium]
MIKILYTAKPAAVRLLLSLFLIPSSARTQVILSEIMFDLSGTDSPNEFVEVFNLSRRDTVDLSRWKIADNSSVDDLTDGGMGMILFPRSYAVILEGDYPAGAGSGLYASLIPDTVLLVKVDDSAIGNQLSVTDTVTLLDDSGNPVDSHGWVDIYAPGFSLERISLEGPSAPENWTVSTVPLGTPGTPNSVTPPEIDAAIDTMSVAHTPLHPEPYESTLLTATVANLGTETIQGDLWVTERGVVLSHQAFEDLRSGDSLSLSSTLEPLDPGYHVLYLVVEVQGDGNPDNDTARHAITVRFPAGSMTINEIHVIPGPGVPEFVELVNLQGGDADLTGWRFSDSDTGEVRILPSGTIPSGGFGIIAADSSLLSMVPTLSPLVIPRNGFPPLNNAGDTLFLFDPTGVLMDRVPYAPHWDLVRGRSLEKLHPSLESQVDRNWGPSVAPEGMTPGRENSIFLETLPSTGVITLNPNPFSPDGDRVEDEMRISYRLPYTQAYVTALIFDSRGRPVRTVARNLAVGSQGVLTWDGATDRGRRARIGVYVLKVVAVDRETRESLEWVKTAILAEPLR